ncbi:MAG: LPS export ABC transporter permease LptG [Myxococcales bacterium]|nr:LPS export ABC transporter permease LptG [Myxococcales bacterium]
MSILTRYVSREFLKLFALCLTALILIYLVFDFIDRAGNFFRGDPSLLHVLLYYVYKIPTIVFQLVPVSVLLAVLLNLANMSRNSEITAMKAGGVSVPRLVAPLVLLSVLIAGGALAVNEFVVPAATTQMKYIQTVHIKGQDWRIKLRDKNLWYKSPGAIYHIRNFDPALGRLEGLQVFRFNDRFALTERLDAESAQWANGRWLAFNGIRRAFAAGALTAETPFAETGLELPETPDRLKVYKRDPEQMSFRELSGYVRELRTEGYDVRKYEVDLHGKISFALVTVIMALLGIPWAIKSGRQGGVAFGIGVAVIIGVAYWIVLGFSLALGRSGALPVIVSAWAPHLLFGAVGLVGILRVRS